MNYFLRRILVQLKLQINDQFILNQNNFDVHKSDSYNSPREDFYNMSAEEGIYPNVAYSYPVTAPSYQPDYDYNNEYSTTPLVYSWMPIVPGLYEREGTDNLHNFEHIIQKLDPHPLNISTDNKVIFDQNNHNFFENNYEKTDSRLSTQTLNQLEDSSNAVDLSTSCNKECSILRTELSFNGKIAEIVASENKTEETQKCSDKVLFNLSLEDDDELNENALKNKVEGILKVLDVDERSPLINKSSEMKPPMRKEIKDLSKTAKFGCLKERDSFIVDKLKSSLAESYVPPSINTLQLSLSEMLTMYHHNVKNSTNVSKSVIASNSLFVPSHPFNEMLSSEWPEITQVQAPLIAYNRSTDCEDIEVMCNVYSQKFIRAETSSSFNHKIGPTSAKKKIERQK
jgi:hypothetical protein